MASALVGLPFHPSLLKADLLLRDDADLVVVGLDFVVLKELARRPHPEDDFVGLGLGLDVGFGVSVNLNLDAGDGSSRFRDGSFIGKIPARQLRDSLQFRTLEL